MTFAINPLLEFHRLPTLAFLGDGPDEELDAVGVAKRLPPLIKALRAHFKPGDRVGLLYRSEPMLVLAWLAALYAGLEPLMLQFPNAKQNLVTWRASIGHIVKSVKLAGIICAQEVDAAGIPDCRLLFLAETRSAESSGIAIPALTANTPILQMSSGTTGHRKAIRFTLGQVASHVSDYNETLRLDAGDRIVSWLPLYHDMGFIACFVMPLMLGIPVCMMDPMAWIREPKRLFQAINQPASHDLLYAKFWLRGDGQARQWTDIPVDAAMDFVFRACLSRDHGSICRGDGY